MEYNASNENCYPGTAVLINKFGIRSDSELNDLESLITTSKAAEILSSWKFENVDFGYYKKIHQYMFEDIYDWAGTVRTALISKKGTVFCHPEEIDGCGDIIFDSLKKSDFYCDLDKKDFVHSIAGLYDSINMLHPFREGNGRMQRAFFSLLAENAGYHINFDKCDKDYLMIATIQAAHGVKDNLENFFDEYTLKTTDLK